MLTGGLESVKGIFGVILWFWCLVVVIRLCVMGVRGPSGCLGSSWGCYNEILDIF